MAELTESDIISKITTIDAEIAKITGTLGTAGTGAVANVDYKIGNKSVNGSQRLEGLLKAREMYQKLLATVPKVIQAEVPYTIEDGTGTELNERIGDA